MQLYVIRRPSAWANLAELEVAGAKSARIGDEEMPDRVRWIRSYAVRTAASAPCASTRRATSPRSSSTRAASACPPKTSARSPRR